MRGNRQRENPVELKKPNKGKTDRKNKETHEMLS